MTNLLSPSVQLDWMAGSMSGAPVRNSVKTLAQMRPLFRDQASAESMNPEQILYRVQWWETVPTGTSGGLYWGVTSIEPGRVGDEFFMTHGHFHADPTRAEYYGTTQGEGMLVLMDRDRKTWAERMTPGSLHYIDGRHAHRVVNTGDVPLIFWACWPADAGYDYSTIASEGFGARVMQTNEGPVLMAQSEL